MRRLYADMSPGLGWDGREPEALEAATATDVTPRTAVSFNAAGVAALAAIPRPLAFLVGGPTPSDAPAFLTVTGTSEGADAVEVVYLPVDSNGDRTAGAVCTRTVWSAIDNIEHEGGAGTGATVATGFGLIPGVSDLRVIAIEIWLTAFPDRRRPGMLDAFQIDEIVRPSSNKVDGALATPNGNYNTPFALDKIGDVGRIARDFCLAEAGSMQPNVFPFDYVEKRKNAQGDLDRLRKAIASVGVAPPDPAKNVGGNIGAIGDNPPCSPPPMFSDSLGDFA